MSIATKNTITNSRPPVKMLNRNNNESNNNNNNNNSNSSNCNNLIRNLQLSNLLLQSSLKDNPNFLNNIKMNLNRESALRNNCNNLTKEYDDALQMVTSNNNSIVLPCPTPSPMIEKLSLESNAKLGPMVLPADMRKVLVIYTGGTIGMIRLNGDDGLVPIPKMLEATVRSFPNLHDAKYAKACFGDMESQPLVLPKAEDATCRVAYTIHEYDPLLDSTNMTMEDWITIARDIKKYYDDYDGFVVLHGTDTLAYTAPALSFMLENLGKSVVVTGSQIPLFESRSDGRDNFLGALIMAGQYVIPEVTVYFGNRLFRGNRIAKVSSDRLNAFDSPNLSPLATLGINIEVDSNLLLQQKSLGDFQLNTSLNQNVALLRIYPSITADTVRAFLQSPMAGVVLQTYGAGNFPTNRADILEELRLASERGLLIVNCTQCSHGSVSAIYETGKKTEAAGVIPGFDMTPEAALTKLSYVLGRSDWDLATKREMIQTSLRGELTKLSKSPSSEFQKSNSGKGEVVIELNGVAEDGRGKTEENQMQRFAKKVGSRFGVNKNISSNVLTPVEKVSPSTVNTGKVAVSQNSASIELNIDDLAFLLGKTSNSNRSSWVQVAGIIFASQLLLVFCLAVLL